MGLLSSLLEHISGSISFTISLKGDEVATISIKDKEILVDVKNVFLVLQLGFMQFLKKKKSGSKTLTKLKEKGFKIVVRYKGLKFEL